MRIRTRAVHSGEKDIKRQNRSVTIPIEQAATYYFENTQQIIDFYNGKLSGVKYGRYGCPVQHAIEKKIADLENTDRALLFSSGMSALTTTILSLARKGDHALFTTDCYRNTRRFFTEILPRFGIESTGISVEDTLNIESYLKPNTSLFFSELPTNPFLRVINLDRIVRSTKRRGIVNIIDSTFATPINLKPVEHGADLVLHSATKYLGGHNDLCAGVIAGKAEIIEKTQQFRDILGGIIDPHTAYLLLRSLQTLPIRMKEHNENGLFLANWLEKNPKVERVWYPGLKSHPDYKFSRSLMSGFGGVITFSLRMSEVETSKFIDSLEIPYIATNFGGPQSLIEQHAVLTFYKERSSANKNKIYGNLIRYSVGFEDPLDVIKDFQKAFTKS